MLGKVLGSWRIRKLLGQGGMAEVYLAESTDQTPTRKVALKIFQGEYQKELLDRFRQEASILRGLSHPNIVDLIETGEYEGRPYFVMEYVDGLPMNKVLEQRGKLHWDEVTEIGKVLSSALSYAHKHDVIHCDIKPGNLLANWDREIKIVDFGIARIAGTRASGSNMGTVDYLSPEQASGKAASRKSDLYSLGIVLYELLTGRLPFTAENDEEMLQKHRNGKFESVKKIIPDVPFELDELLTSLLEKDPEKRPTNAKSVEETLIRLQKKGLKGKPDTIKDLTAQKTRLIEGGSKSTNWNSIKPKETTESGFKTLFQAAGLLTMLAGLIALWWWLKQAPAPEELYKQAEESLQQNYYADALSKLDKLQEAHGTAMQEQVQILRQRITTQRDLQSVKGSIIFTPLQSEAERFYRQGVILFHEGKVEEARSAWENLSIAFEKLPEHAVWVQLAKDALAASKKSESEQLKKQLQLLMDKAKDEVKEVALKRLLAIKKLYQSRANLPELQETWTRLNKLLKDLEK